MAIATNMGIIAMLVVVAGVLGAFASFFIYLMRRAKRSVAAQEASGGDRSMMEKWLGMPIQASTHAAQIDQMTVLVHWLMLVLFVGWGTFFIFVLFRFRQGAQSARRLRRRQGQVREVHRNRRRRHRGRAARRSTRFPRGRCA